MGKGQRAEYIEAEEGIAWNEEVGINDELRRTGRTGAMSCFKFLSQYLLRVAE
jgi:hypothetical protein